MNVMPTMGQEQSDNETIIAGSLRRLNVNIDLISEAANLLAHRLDWVLQPSGPDSPEKSVAEVRSPLSQLTITLDDFAYRIDRTRRVLDELRERCEL